MKNLFILLVIINISCQKKITSQNNNEEKFVIENLKNVRNFPDDYFFPKGDSIYEKILSQGKKITPLLIEKITDTTKSNILYADITRYRVGDVAINLLDNLYDNNKFPIRKIIENEFHKNDINAKESMYIMLYHRTFFIGSNKINYENRKKFQEIVKKHLKIDD